MPFLLDSKNIGGDIIMDSSYETSSEEQAQSFYSEISRLNNELVTAHREIVKKNVELEKLSSLKNQFLGMAAHDLRAPLSSIISFSEFLSEDFDESFNNEQKKFLDIIKSSSKHMMNIINNFLDVSIIENEKLELELENVDLVSIISETILVNKIKAATKNIDVIFYHEEIPTVAVDVTKIIQVITNLISNAVKFSNENSKVLIELSKKDNNILIVVEDKGQGIPENEINKLFDPFTRTSIKSTDGQRNVGLGLMIVHKIVERHNGKITVESKLGVGSKFIVSLPINAA